MYGRRPIDTRTTSASTCSALPPFAGSTVRLTPERVVLAPVTFVPNRNEKPCFFKVRCMVLESSASIVGRILSRNSMTSTSAPSRRQTTPISSPITPPPITTNFFGTFFSSNAPVEVTIFFSSTSTPGKGVDSEPVAMRICFVSSTLSPLSKATLTLPGPRISPRPCT